MTEIRPATESDRLALFKLCVAMHEETDFRNYTLNPQKMLHGIGFWMHNALLLVAVKDSELIGFFMGKVTQPWYSDDMAAVEDCFYVRPEHRGSRAGYLLVREFCSWAKAKGVRHVRAGVSSGSGEAGGRLYEHFGMKFMGGNYIAHIKEDGHVLQ